MNEPNVCGTARTCVSAYDRFADVYNRHWRRSSLHWVQWCAPLLVSRLRRSAMVLDLCCGAGHLTGALSAAGLRVVGLDGSSAMLRYASMNAPGVPLVQADARKFGLRSAFDAVICTFDSLNHLLNEEDLAGCFRSVRSCLLPGGLFFFDLNTERGYLSQWKGERKLRIGSDTVFTRSEYDPVTRLARFGALIVGSSGDKATAAEMVLWQRCHDHEMIQSVLESCGLKPVEMFGLQQDAVVNEGRPAEVERLFYLYERTASDTG